MSHSESKKSTRNQNLSVNSTFDGENNFQFVSSNDNEIVFTDHGAIEGAFSVVGSTVDAFGESTDKTISALKEFATQITVGDVESAKLIALAIVGAVALAAIVYFITSVF
ncbi:MAG: hypothetical protein ACRBBR_00655 [Cellvibrionaceae bacterium]